MPAGSPEPIALDGGLTFGSLHDAAARVPFDPLVPTWLPKGFRLEEAFSFAWGYGLSPCNVWSGTGIAIVRRDLPHEEIDLVYRRGLDWICLQQMATREGDPAAPGLFQWLDHPRYHMGTEKTALGSGAMAGSTARTWLAYVHLPPSDGCGLLALNSVAGEPALRITGTVRRSEMLAVANSMEQYGK